MFERFTERARQVVALAQDEAREMRHGYIGTEHLLLGLLREEEGLAAHVLESLEVNLDELRAEIGKVVGPGDEPSLVGQLPLSPRAKRVLELALREALSLGHNYIGTEHILLGLARENEGTATRVLLDHDVTAEKIRNEIIRKLSGRKSALTPKPDPEPPTLAYVYALHEIVATLGPTVGCPHIGCAGCLAEMTEALRIAKEAIA